MSIISRAIIGLSFVTTLNLAYAEQCGEHFNQSRPVIINQKATVNGQSFCYQSFGLYASGITRTPLWVAERLTKYNLTMASSLPRVDDFHPETSIPYKHRAELSDYSRSGYDRGHMAPNADMPNASAQYESFSLTNIVPQNSELNQGLWSEIEMSVRSAAKKQGELYVVTGPAFIPDENGQLDALKGRVLVPTHIWKAIYNPKTKQAGAYWVANQNVSNFETISIDELTNLIGIDVFPALPSAVKTSAMKLPYYKSNRHRKYTSSATKFFSKHLHY